MRIDPPRTSPQGSLRVVPPAPYYLSRLRAPTGSWRREQFTRRRQMRLGLIHLRVWDALSVFRRIGF